MTSVVVALLQTVLFSWRSRAALHAEILALRHQLHVLQRSRPQRIRLTAADRALWIWLSRIWSGWSTATMLVKPATVVAWHRQGFRLFWTWKSEASSGPPEDPDGGSLVDPNDVRGQSALGRAADSRRTPEIGINVSQSAVTRWTSLPRGTASVSTSSRKAACLYTRAGGDTSGADPMSRRETRGCPPRIGYDSSQRRDDDEIGTCVWSDCDRSHRR
jgi:hypothetical protein